MSDHASAIEREAIRDLLQRRVRTLEAEFEHYATEHDATEMLHTITGGIMELAALARHYGVTLEHAMLEPTYLKEDVALYPTTALCELLKKRDSL